MNQDEADQDVADEMSEKDVRCVCVFYSSLFSSFVFDKFPHDIKPLPQPPPCDTTLTTKPTFTSKKCAFRAY